MTQTAFDHELRKLLLSKISDNWYFWQEKGHGSSFMGIEALPSKRSFYQNLQLDIRESLIVPRGANQATELMRSTATLRRFLEPESDRKFRKEFHQAISIYLGFKSYAEFRASQIIEPPTFAQVLIKRLHQKSKAGTALTIRPHKWENGDNENGKFENIPIIEDASFTEVKKKQKANLLPWLLIAIAIIASLLGFGREVLTLFYG